MQQLSRNYLKSPDFIDLVGEDDVKIPSTITHWSYATQRDTRADILGLVATVYGSDKRSIVFTQVIDLTSIHDRRPTAVARSPLR